MAFSIRLSPEDEARLAEFAANTGRSTTFYIREAIHQHLDDVENGTWPVA